MVGGRFLSMSSPTQRSLAFAREQGWPCAIVERWNEHAYIRQDLWGVIDLLVLDDEPGVLAVQACAGASHANRTAKVIQAIVGISIGAASKLTQAAIERRAAALRKWIAKGNRIEVWSWSKHGARYKRKLWVLRRELIHSHQPEIDLHARRREEAPQASPL